MTRRWGKQSPRRHLLGVYAVITLGGLLYLLLLSKT